MEQITSVTPTVCRLMGIPPPKISTDRVLIRVVDEAKKLLGESKIEKCLVYAPDAIGESLFRDYSPEFEPVTRLAPLQVPLRSVYPTVTPVCFASMFTGALPEAHGIKKYEKPVLSCDTLFDALLRAGKRVAIVAVRECSIAKIFLNRGLDYFIEVYDDQVNAQVLRLIDEGSHDFILAYNQGYDDAMHRTTPRSDEALEAMRKILKTFPRLAEAFMKRNERHARLILFAPDHGTHIDPGTGRGSHGLDTPEDMEVRSFWGIYPGK